MSGTTKKQYTMSLKTIESVLELQNMSTVRDMAVQFGCTGAVTLAQQIVQRYCIFNTRVRAAEPCADPEGGGGGGGGGGGARGPDPPWNLKILPKKGNFGIFLGLDPPSSVTKNYHFRWTPSHENFWIRACEHNL